MELDPQEQIWARNWFYGAGTAAILLAFFLPFVDYKLSNSDREIRVAETIRELRTAQFGLGSKNIDHRLTSEGSVPAPAPQEQELAHEPPAGHGAEAHAEHGATDVSTESAEAPAVESEADAPAADAEPKNSAEGDTATEQAAEGPVS